MLTSTPPLLPQPAVIDVGGEKISDGVISPDGRFAALAVQRFEGDEHVREFFENVELWDLQAKRLTAKAVIRSRAVVRGGGYSTDPRYLRYSGDGRRLLAYDGETAIHVLNSADLNEVRTIRLELAESPRKAQVLSFAVPQEGNRVALLVAWQDRPSLRATLFIYDFETAKKIATISLMGLFPSGDSIAFDATGTKVALTLPSRNVTIDASGRIGRKHGNDLRVFEVPSGRELCSADTDFWAGPIQFGASEALLLASLDRGHKDPIKIFDSRSCKPLRNIGDESKFGVHHQLSVSSDGKRVIGFTGREKYDRLSHGTDIVSQQFALWDVDSGRNLATSPNITPITMQVPELRISPNGQSAIVFWTIGPRKLLLFDVSTH